MMRGMDAGSVDAIITDPPYGSTRTTIGGADAERGRLREQMVRVRGVALFE